MRHLSPLSALAPAALIALSGCVYGGWGSPDVWIAEDEEFSIPADGLREVWIETHNGGIDARSSRAAAAVEVHVEKRAGGDDIEDARAAMDAIAIRREVRDGRLELGWEWRGERRRDWGAGVSFEVRHPEGLSLSVETHNGTVVVRGRHAQLSAATHNGEVTVDTTADRVDLGTHNGTIRADLGAVAAPSGRITTHNGSVVLTLGASASTRIAAASHNGSISCSLPLDDPFRGHNFLSGELGSGEGELRVRMHNGTLTIREGEAGQ